MKIDTLHDLYIHGIRDMRTGCAKTFDAMEKMRDAASHDDVRALVDGGLKQMHGAMEMFDRILERHGAPADETANKALKALAEEAAEWTDGIYADDRLRDLAIVEKTRNIAFYPDAGFTAFRHQAQALGYEDDARELGGETKPCGEEDQTAMMDRVERTLLDGLRQAEA
jgi:ferritin-like metal-binding protein YciE